MKAILLGLVQCTNREHGSASNKPIHQNACVLGLYWGGGGGGGVSTVDESLYFADKAIVGFPWECVLMCAYGWWCGSIMDTRGDEASHPPAVIPPWGLFIPLERPAFHRGHRRLKPCLSPSLNG